MVKMVKMMMLLVNPVVKILMAFAHSFTTWQ